jgi:geranylgeranylglycerol-phosphate geranylgeranyltransferase
MGREVLKGVADVDGDTLRKVRTIAISRGTRSARVVSSVFFLSAVASSALPVISGLLGRALPVYLGLIVITDAVFVWLAYRVLSSKSKAEALKLKTFALGGMMLGLISYLISGLLV